MELLSLMILTDPMVWLEYRGQGGELDAGWSIGWFNPDPTALLTYNITITIIIVDSETMEFFIQIVGVTIVIIAAMV